MARVLSLALLALAPVDAGDAVKTGTVASETGELFLCASTQLQHADMLYRVDVSGSEMKVTASLEMPADADKDGWKKSVCGAAPASVAADGTLYWALDAMYTENNPVGPSILAVQSDVEPFAGLRVASRTVLPVACDLARVNYCNANGLVVDGDTLWVGVNEYLVSYDLPLTDDSKPATSEKYAAGGWGCPAGYLTSLKSLTVHGGKLYGVATCDGDAPAATNLVVRFHKKGAPEAWATFPNSDGGVLDELLSDGADLLVVGTGDGRYAQVPPALFRVADGSGAANLTVVEDLQLLARGKPSLAVGRVALALVLRRRGRDGMALGVGGLARHGAEHGPVAADGAGSQRGEEKREGSGHLKRSGQFICALLLGSHPQKDIPNTRRRQQG